MVDVSVIAPVYNMEQYLVKCMDSLVNQTLETIEIVCVDDGSTDRSYAILKQYEEELSYKLLSTEEIKGGYHFKFNVASILRADQQSQKRERWSGHCTQSGDSEEHRTIYWFCGFR